MKSKLALLQLFAAVKALAERQEKLRTEAKKKAKLLRLRPGILPATKAKKVDDDDPIGMTEEDAKSFRLARAIKAALTGDWKGARLERDACMATLEHRTRSGLKTATLGDNLNAGFLVPNRVWDQIIQPLRPNTFLDKLGVNRFTGLTYAPFEMPRITSEGSAGWIAEGSTASVTDIADDQIASNPHTAYAARRFSLKLFALAGPQIEKILRTAIMEVHKRLVEKAYIEGTGVSGQPLGVNNISGINTIAFTSANADAKLTKLKQMIEEIDVDNVPLEGLAWVMHPRIWADIDQIQVALSSASAAAGLTPSVPLGLFNTTGDPAKPLARSLAGIPVYTTTNLTTSTTGVITLAAWPMTNYFEWGTPEVVMTREGQTLTLARQALLALFQDVDVNVMHPEAVCTGTAYTF